MSNDDAQNPTPPVDDQVQLSKDWRQFDTPARAVVELTAIATDRELTALPPLQYHIDAESLNQILLTDSAAESMTITFEYADVCVRLEHTGAIDIVVKETSTS